MTGLEGDGCGAGAGSVGAVGDVGEPGDGTGFATGLDALAGAGPLSLEPPPPLQPASTERVINRASAAIPGERREYFICVILVATRDPASGKVSVTSK